MPIPSDESQIFDKTIYFIRLEEEEQQKQKLQLEKVAADGKLKQLEESVNILEDSNQKVSFIAS